MSTVIEIRSKLARLWWALALVGCGASNITTGAAQATYGAELQACVAKSATRAAADACIHEVKANWAGLNGRDAGANPIDAIDASATDAGDSGSDAGAKDGSK